MHDLALQAAGALAIVVAIVHGAIGETWVFGSSGSKVAPPSVRRLLHVVWQLTTVDWIGLGVLLLMAPRFGAGMARGWVVAICVTVYSCAAIGNAYATKGRHIGWVLMSCVVGLALLGA
jgi:hypothetical protein